MQLLERFDYTDVVLWQKVHDAIVSIYNAGDDWKRVKEEALTEKHQ